MENLSCVFFGGGLVFEISIRFLLDSPISHDFWRELYDWRAVFFSKLLPLAPVRPCEDRTT